MRIMVVEDDAPLRDALATSLGAHGYEVTEAGSAEEAVVLAGFDVPDLVLLDLSLPGADGFHAPPAPHLHSTPVSCSRCATPRPTSWPRSTAAPTTTS